ncbi:carboxymuconolactone decarboxylase family protein [Kordiimonas sp. SCSIO 12603]|uniref:carboxymuconolactone decarboxylase family protein n=1 Tax=Kordiimonas sp. SCSIO 12603 TaxID=2829596 RepID=UPI0021030A3A|nr:carboxymuconolactone decarboxylase family protein [Kordiimonas sp. SCSIO 12603]UTW58772.1 carboxymuconolactone decarboxylase family protein [Kordiimonas sp. SCSIO 12603]
MNTDKFPLLEKDTAPEASVEWLEKAEENFGMIPNVEKVMALSPQLLAGYTFMWDGFNTASLDAQERQVVYLTANYENECNYCVPWHSILAEQSGLSEKDIEALKGGGSLSDSKQNALSQFTRLLIANRGKVSQMQLQEFFDAGYNSQQALEVILALAVKLISNYTNSIAGTPLDQEAAHKRWVKPVIREA